MIIEIRDNLFAILLRVSQARASSVVIDRLCMSIALIALKTVNSAWPNSIADIITFGSTNEHQCSLSLILLKNVCSLFQSQMWERRLSHQIEEFIREQLSSVLQFVCSILKQDTLSKECYVQALKAAKNWVSYSTHTFVPNPEFIELIF